jgi:hypothetical protein
LGGCTVTVAPAGSANVAGTYDDVNTLSFNNVSISEWGWLYREFFTISRTFRFISNLQDVS